MPSLEKIALTCFSTEDSDSVRRLAVPAFPRPCAISRNRLARRSARVFQRRLDLWQDFVEQRHVCHWCRRLDGEKVVGMSSTRVLAKMRHFWNQQLGLHQLYLDRHDVSGRDAIDALARRGNAKSGAAGGDRAG
jgi:hypothetical protein